MPKVESVGEGDENELKRPSLYAVWSLVMPKSGVEAQNHVMIRFIIKDITTSSTFDRTITPIRVPSLKYTWQACLNCGSFIQNSQASSLPVGKQNHHQKQPQRKILY